MFLGFSRKIIDVSKEPGSWMTAVARTFSTNPRTRVIVVTRHCAPFSSMAVHRRKSHKNLDLPTAAYGNGSMSFANIAANRAKSPPFSRPESRTPSHNRASLRGFRYRQRNPRCGGPSRIGVVVSRAPPTEDTLGRAVSLFATVGADRKSTRLNSSH